MLFSSSDRWEWNPSRSSSGVAQDPRWCRCSAVGPAPPGGPAPVTTRWLLACCGTFRRTPSSLSSRCCCCCFPSPSSPTWSCCRFHGDGTSAAERRRRPSSWLVLPWMESHAMIWFWEAESEQPDTSGTGPERRRQRRWATSRGQQQPSWKRH